MVNFNGGSQFFIDEKYAFADIAGFEYIEFVYKTCQKYTTSQFVVLTVHVNRVSGVEIHEVANRVERNYELVEGQIGIVLKAKMMNFPIFAPLQYLLLDFFAVFILSDVPNLKISTVDMLLEILQHIVLWIGNVI